MVGWVEDFGVLSVFDMAHLPGVSKTHFALCMGVEPVPFFNPTLAAGFGEGGNVPFRGGFGGRLKKLTCRMVHQYTCAGNKMLPSAPLPLGCYCHQPSSLRSKGRRMMGDRFVSLQVSC